MSYCVIRTDLMSGTKQPADLVSLRFCTATTTGSGASAVTKYTPAEVENGVVVKLIGYEEGQREVMTAVAASSSDDLNECAIVAGVELMYDERKKGLDEYINEAGKATRGYIPRSRNLFSVTKEGFVGGTVPVVGDTIGIGTGGKLDKSGSGFGECVAIETVGRYIFYTIRIGKTELE